jgi:hypothetical protein
MAGMVHAPPRNIVGVLLAILIVTSLVLQVALQVVLHTPKRSLVCSKIDFIKQIASCSHDRSGLGRTDYCELALRDPISLKISL